MMFFKPKSKGGKTLAFTALLRALYCTFVKTKGEEKKKGGYTF